MRGKENLKTNIGIIFHPRSVRNVEDHLAQEIADSRKRVGKPLTQLVLEIRTMDRDPLPIAELGSDGVIRRSM